MPSASAANVEKPKSEIKDSCAKLCIKFLEHKIRNLEKRKGRLESYQQLKCNGKRLEQDQILAMEKYGEVSATLDFARDIVKTMKVYAAEAAQEEEETLAKQKGKELSNIKLILELQDLLAQLLVDDVKENFLSGVNGAVEVSQEKIGHLNAFYAEIYPEPEESQDNANATNSSVKRDSAAQHIQNFMEGKPVEIVGTTYEELKNTVDGIRSCEYFSQIIVVPPKVVVPETSETVETVDSPVSAPEEPEVEVEPEATVEVESPVYNQQKNVTVPVTTNLRENNSFYSDPVPGAVPSQFLPKNEVPPQPPQPVQPLSGITSNSAFNFLQDSELDSPEGLNVALGVTPTPPPASALPIPSQTFTNPLYIPPPPIPMPPSHLQQPPNQQNVSLSPGASVVSGGLNVSASEGENCVTNWADANHESWASQSETVETSWANDDWDSGNVAESNSYQPTSNSSEWTPHQDGFITQGRSNYRGNSDNRGRGRQPRRNRGGRGARGANSNSQYSNSHIRDYSSNRKSEGNEQTTNGYLSKSGNNGGSGNSNSYSRRGGSSFSNRSSSTFKRGNDRGDRNDYRGDRTERIDRSDRGDRGDRRDQERGDRSSRGDRMNERRDMPRKGTGNYGNERGSYSSNSNRGARGSRNVQSSSGYV